jgi:hypothetical protein
LTTTAIGKKNSLPKASLITNKRPVIIHGKDWHRREIFFLVKILLIQPKSNIFYPTSNINLKIEYPPLTKNITKGYNSVVTHVLYHFCDYTITLWFPCLDGLIQTRGNVARVKGE